MERRDEIISASYLPEKVITNQEIIDAGLDSTAVALERSLGVKERRAAADLETNADMMANVANQILKKAGYKAEEIDLIICNSNPGDSAEPDTSAAVQAKIGAICPVIGVTLSCTGWIAGIDIALRYLATGKKRILVLAGCLLGSRTHFYNLMHRAIFGDGAGGILIESHQRNKFLSTVLWTAGQYYSKIFSPYPWSKRPEEIPAEYEGSFYMSPDQKMFFNAIDSYLPFLCNQLLKEAKLNIKDIAFFLLHYPSKPLFEHSLEAFPVPRSKILVNFKRYGNIVAAEMPVLLDEAIREGRIKRGDFIFVFTYGAGFTSGGFIMRY